MKQVTFADAEYASKKRVTRRDKFLGEMERIVPWAALLDKLQPFYYPNKKGPGRPPIGLERILRMYFVQQWYNLSDEGLEDAIYDSHALRQFIGIDLSQESVPDATSVLRFRRLLETNELTAVILETINATLREQGMLLNQGTVVDATIIAAPASTKNRTHSRDPEMHQTKKGNQWYFGMKAHIGVDVHTGVVHTVIGTPANTSDVSQAPLLLHGNETMAFGDAGYIGADQRSEESGHAVTWYIAKKRGSVKSLPEGAHKEQVKSFERRKAQLRAIVEHPFHVIKDLFGFRKVRYRGLAKNTAHLFTLFALGNLLITKKYQLA